MKNIVARKNKQEWWIPGILPKNRLVLLSAMGGTGKTSLALFLATRLCIEKQAQVAFWSFEDSNQDLRNKMSDREFVDTLGFFHYMSNDGVLRLTREKDAIQLNNFLAENGIDVLIIDPISQLLSGDTNDNQKVRATLAPLLQMTEYLDLTILGIHHFRKPSRSGTGSARGNIMGASAWVDSSRHVLSLVKNDQDQRFLEVVKSNVARTGQSWEVFTEVSEQDHFFVSGIAEVADGAAQRALEDPKEERLAPVIQNLKAEFALGQPFNMEDVERCGNLKSFYNWRRAHPNAWQECEKKKDGKKTYIFI